jgi:hypothetical protein
LQVASSSPREGDEAPFATLLEEKSLAGSRAPGRASKNQKSETKAWLTLTHPFSFCFCHHMPSFTALCLLSFTVPRNFEAFETYSCECKECFCFTYRLVFTRRLVGPKKRTAVQHCPTHKKRLFSKPFDASFLEFLAERKTMFCGEQGGLVNVAEEPKIEYMVGLYSSERPNKARDGRVVKMVASSGKEFSCLLPSANEEPEEEEAEEGLLRDKVFRKIRRTLRNKCVTLNSGYWTYEVCFFKKVTQYHGNSNAGSSRTEFFLGTHRADLDDFPLLETPLPPAGEKEAKRDEQKNQERASLPSKKSLAGLSYVQRYMGGTSGRRAVVNFVCNPNAGQSSELIEVEEPRTHMYSLTVSSPQVCLSQNERSNFSLFLSLVFSISFLTEDARPNLPCCTCRQ